MSKFAAFFRDFLTPALVLTLAGIIAYDHLMPREPVVVVSVVNGKVLGRKFAGAIAARFGDAWLFAADTLEAGKSIADAQAVMQAKWQAGRTEAFAAEVTPEFAKVLGEGLEPTNPTQRASVVKLWRDFATGLKGGR